MTITQITKKLIGSVQPLGDASRDDERLENLKRMCELVDDLIDEIKEIDTRNRNSYEHSVKEAVNYASEWLDKTAIMCQRRQPEVLAECLEALEGISIDIRDRKDSEDFLSMTSKKDLESCISKLKSLI